MTLGNFINSITLSLAVLSVPAHAHLMVAEHGTLRIVDSAAFMVVSVPISAFASIDEDGDGEVSMIEFNRSRAEVLEKVERNIFMQSAEGRIELQGTMLSPVIPHGSTDDVLTDLVVLGRFNLPEPDTGLRFEYGLFGQTGSKQSLKMSVNKPSVAYKDDVVLTPASRILTM